MRLPQATKDKIIAMAERGVPLSTIAHKLGLSVHTARYWGDPQEAARRHARYIANKQPRAPRGEAAFNPVKLQIRGITQELSKLYSMQTAADHAIDRKKKRLEQIRAQISDLIDERLALRRKLKPRE